MREPSLPTPLVPASLLPTGTLMRRNGRTFEVTIKEAHYYDPEDDTRGMVPWVTRQRVWAEAEAA